MGRLQKNGEVPAGTPPMYSDSPLPLLSTPAYLTGKNDPFTLVASHMTLSHNALIRGFNTIYQLAPRLPSSDYADFVKYCLAWHACVTQHHEYEEAEFFPAIERAVGVKGVMDGEIHEHALFSYGMEQLHAYLKRIEGSDPQAYFHSPTILRLLDSFSDPLLKHLASEPQALLNLSRFSSNPNSPGSYPNPPARPEDPIARFDPNNPMHHPANAGLPALPTPPLSAHSAPSSGSLGPRPLPSLPPGTHPGTHRTTSSASLEPRPALYPMPAPHVERPRPNLGSDLAKISADSNKSQMSMDFMFNVLPVFLLNMETREFEGGMWHGVFPPAKGAGRWVLYGAVPFWKGNKVWRFCSCGKDGAARRLCA